MFLQLQFAIRNIYRHKIRSSITLSAIVFGCVALIFIGGFFEDLYSQMRDTFINGNSGHLQVYKKGYTQRGRIEPHKYFIADHQHIQSLILTLPEVAYVTPRIQFFGLISTGKVATSFLGQGVDPLREKTFLVSQVKDLRNLYEGHHYKPLPIVNSGEGLTSENEFAILMGRGLAESVDIKTGMPVTVMTSTLSGSTNALDVKVKGIAQVAIKSVDDLFVRMPLDIAQKLLNTKKVQSLVIQLHNTSDTAKVKTQLEGMFTHQNLDLEVKDWEELNDFYGKTVKMFDMFHVIVRFVVLIVVGLGIFNTMNMSVIERTSEIGTMMALGSGKRDIVSLFLCEGFVIGVIGGILGVLSGCLIVSTIAKIGIMMPPGPGSTVEWLSHPMIVHSILWITFCMAIGIAVISSVYPAYAAARMQVVEALRRR